MKARCLVILAIWLLFAGNAPTEQGAGADGKALQGTWTAVSVEEVGKQQPKEGLDKVKLTIQGEKFKIQEGDYSVEGTFTIGPSTKPKTFDAKVLGKSGTATATLGIYKLEGDTLTVCYDVDRPAEFKTTAKLGLLIVFKRAK